LETGKDDSSVCFNYCLSTKKGDFVPASSGGGSKRWTYYFQGDKAQRTGAVRITTLQTYHQKECLLGFEIQSRWVNRIKFTDKTPALQTF